MRRRRSRRDRGVSSGARCHAGEEASLRQRDLAGAVAWTCSRPRGRRPQQADAHSRLSAGPGGPKSVRAGALVPERRAAARPHRHAARVSAQTAAHLPRTRPRGPAVRRLAWRRSPAGSRSRRGMRARRWRCRPPTPCARSMRPEGRSPAHCRGGLGRGAAWASGASGRLPERPACAEAPSGADLNTPPSGPMSRGPLRRPGRPRRVRLPSPLPPAARVEPERWPTATRSGDERGRRRSAREGGRRPAHGGGAGALPVPLSAIVGAPGPSCGDRRSSVPPPPSGEGGADGAVGPARTRPPQSLAWAKPARGGEARDGQRRRALVVEPHLLDRAGLADLHVAEVEPLVEEPHGRGGGAGRRCRGRARGRSAWGGPGGRPRTGRPP